MDSNDITAKVSGEQKHYFYSKNHSWRTRGFATRENIVVGEGE
jgi:hypothetical protein